MNESSLGAQSRHQASEAPEAAQPEASHRIGPPHLRFLEDPMWQPQSQADGAFKLPTCDKEFWTDYE